MAPFYFTFKTAGSVVGHAVVLLGLIFWAQASFSAPQEKMPITITSLKIDGLIGVPEDARYNLLLNRISQETGLTIKLHPVPGKRLMREFTRRGEGCLFPDYRAGEEMKVIRSDAFNQALVYLVGLRKNGAVSRENISGYRVGVVNGYGYDPDILKLAEEVVGVETERQNLDMLLFGRVDMIISYFPDLPLVASPQELAEIIYDADQPLSTSPERFACYDTPQNRDFVRQFNAVIARLSESGELVSILSPFFYGMPEKTVKSYTEN